MYLWPFLGNISVPAFNFVQVIHYLGYPYDVIDPQIIHHEYNLRIDTGISLQELIEKGS